MKLESSEVLEIRKKMVLGMPPGSNQNTLLWIRRPLGMKRENMDTLLWLQDHLPSCKTSWVFANNG